jgi:chemotaxis protein methyltransferase CheR
MLNDEDFRHLLAHLDRPWAGFRKIRKGVKKRVRRHMETLACTDIEPYLHYIKTEPRVRADCERCLMVTISRFYRDRRLWDHLQTRRLPELATRFPAGLHAWSAGCARGEEPYSLSMVWEETAANLRPPPELHILATDADALCLEQARKGVYQPSSLKELPEPLRKRWFREGKQARIDPALQNRIDWHPHQLLDEPPDRRFHLILLRNNLLTYYQGPRLQTALTRILEHLVPGGLLILGSHEKLPAGFEYMERDKGCPWVYRDERRC